MEKKLYQIKQGTNDYYNRFVIEAFGKKWKSIRACCDFYGVEYGSVLSYKRIHQCGNEEAISHYIALKKGDSFYFKKKRWNDLKECCEFYKINYKSLKTYMYKYKVDKIGALNHYYDSNKKKRFTFDHVNYHSFEACCKVLGVNPSGVKRYAKKKHFLLHHALKSYLLTQKKRRFIFREIEYSSFTACCNSFNQEAGNILAYARRNNVSKTEALQHYLDGFMFRGVRYVSLKECCDFLGVNVSSVNSYVYRTKQSPQDGIEYLLEVKAQRIFTWIDGAQYENLSVFCKTHGISANSVRNKSRCRGISLLDSALYYISKNEDMASVFLTELV